MTTSTYSTPCYSTSSTIATRRRAITLTLTRPLNPNPNPNPNSNPNPNPNHVLQALVLYGPGFCDWGVKAPLKAQISEVLGMPMPEYIHVVIGGIMLFTAAAVRAFTFTGSRRSDMTARRLHSTPGARLHPNPNPNPHQVRAFTDSTLLMQCIDDLETLYGKHLELWGGLKESALYNQDWLFCWCLQVRYLVITPRGRLVRWCLQACA